VTAVSHALPEGVAARLSAWQSGGAEVAPVRDAATVVLLRDTAAGPEVLLLRRAAALAVAGGMWVFPGGVVSPGDGDWHGDLPTGWAATLATGDEALARALVGAAIRETAEECGVWLAGGPVPDGAPRVAGRRVSTDGLRPWAHWITPDFEPRRYDTRFLVAALPAGARPVIRTAETDDLRWVRPGDTPGLPMLPPTAHTLADLASYPTVAAVLAAPREVSVVRPVAVVVNGKARLAMPWDPGYPAP
jgi:8-oxo-dGTP pyrophosphatase MutT (NUDIX family)